MSVSIIIPTYQRAEYLAKAIQSALNQTYAQFEIWVYDNASQDHTPQVVENCIKKDGRIHYNRHEQNIGMIANYEYALKHVSTPYFCFLSDDDVILPHFLETALRGFKEFPDIGFSAGSTLCIQQDTKQIISVPLDSWSKEGYYLPEEGLLEMIGKYPVPTAIVFRQELAQKFNIDRENSLFWDCDFLLQIAAQFPFYINKKPCALFRVHPNAYSNSRNLEAVQSGFTRLLKRLNDLPPLNMTQKNQAKLLIDAQLNQWLMHFFYHHFFAQRFLEAKNFGILLEKKSLHNSKSYFIYKTVLLFGRAKFVLAIFRYLIQLSKKIRRVDNFQDLKLYEKYASYIDLLN